jgi:3-dehydroquinate synthase
MGMLKEADVARLVKLLERAQLPVAAPAFGLARYMELMGIDKKVESGKIRFILLRGLGTAYLTADVPKSALTTALAASAAHG